jgi:hypothetical protein
MNDLVLADRTNHRSVGSRYAKILRVSVALLVGLALVNLAANVFTFGGDSEIHLVFAKNMVAGHALQFNRGVFSSGETSPLYMTFVAAIMAVLGLSASAVAMKVAGVVSALGIMHLVHGEAKKVFENDSAALSISLCLGASPFFFFQAHLGMENMPFAFAVALVIRSALRPNVSVTRFVSLVAYAHSLFYLRPEAVFLIAFLYASALLDGRTRIRELSACVSLSLLLGASVVAVEQWTGVPLHAAGATRVLISRMSCVHVPGSSIYLNKSPLAFVAYAWPFGIVLASRLRVLSKRLALTIVCFDLLPLFLHLLNFLPNTHFSRYSLYWWYPLIAVTMRTVGRESRRHANLAVNLFVANTLLVSSAELVLRARTNSLFNRFFLDTLATSSDSAVRSMSDRLCAQLECSKVPVSVALQEIQLRLHLDERFVVHSLDGIVDAGFRNYISRDGTIDYVSYFQDERIDVILEFPNFEKSQRPSSLPAILERANGGPVNLDCSEFVRRPLSGFAFETMLLRLSRAECRAPREPSL